MTVSTGEQHSDHSGAPERGGIPVDTFAVRLVLSRIHAGDLTLRDAAEKCGLSFASWSNWERGMKPRDFLEVVQAVSEGLGIDRDWLMWGGPLARQEPSARVLRRRVERHGRREDTGWYLSTTDGQIDSRRAVVSRPPSRRDDNSRPRVLRQPAA